MTKVLRTSLAAALMSALVLAPALAQDDPSTQDPCVARQDDDTSAADEADSARESTSLTETLDRCGGVLEPPAIGDTELVEPAPEKGATPVIPPGQLPDDQPPPDGSAN